MLDRRLINYFVYYLNKGYDKNKIMTSLYNQGYPYQDIIESLHFVENSQKPNIQNQEKSLGNLFLLFIMIVIISILIFGAVFLFTDIFKTQSSVNQENQPKESNNKNNMQEVRTEKSIDESDKLGESQRQVSVPIREDCGSVDNMHILVAPTDKTEDEVKAIDCFNKKLINCSSAIFKLTGQGGATYEIKGNEGDKCLISTIGKTCRVPINLIKYSEEVAKSEGKPEMTLMPIIMGISFGKLTNEQTGEEIKIECS
jgi:cell division protein FtsL